MIWCTVGFGDASLWIVTPVWKSLLTQCLFYFYLIFQSRTRYRSTRASRPCPTRCLNAVWLRNTSLRMALTPSTVSLCLRSNSSTLKVRLLNHNDTIFLVKVYRYNADLIVNFSLHTNAHSNSSHPTQATFCHQHPCHLKITPGWMGEGPGVYSQMHFNY